MRNWRLVAKYVFVIIWMALIFQLSSEASLESSVRSYALTDIIKSFDVQFFAWLNEHIVRKSAHVIMYFILGILICNLLFEYKDKIRYPAYSSIVIACVYACLDEFHQSFVVGRSSEIGDVAIDTLASMLGVLAISLIVRRLRVNEHTN